jgi:hypothetical protein
MLEGDNQVEACFLHLDQMAGKSDKIAVSEKGFLESSGFLKKARTSCLQN